MIHSPPTHDLALQRLAPPHAEAIFALVDASRDDLGKWLQWVESTRSAQDVLTFIAGCEDKFALRESCQFVLSHRGRPAGVIGHVKIDWLNRSTEIGYWLAGPSQRRGLMTRACRAITHHALTELELNRVAIHCAIDNTQSQAIPERLGFQRDGLAREAQRLASGYTDLVVNSMLADEWTGAGVEKDLQRMVAAAWSP